MTSTSVGDILPNSFQFNFNDDLKRRKYYETLNNNAKYPLIPKTAPMPTFQIVENTSRDIIHTGYEKLEKIPYETIKSRYQSFYENGRKLQLLETISYNAGKSAPSAYTPYPRVKIGNVS